MSLLQEDIGLLTLLTVEESDRIERKLRKSFLALTDHVAYVNDEVEGLEWFLNGVLKGRKNRFSSMTEFDLDFRTPTISLSYTRSRRYT